MKKLADGFFVIALLVSGLAPVFAQDTKPFHLELSAAQVQVVLNGLAELKLRESIDTFVVIKRQVDEQQRPMSQDPAPRKPVD
jgi:hypothetical protein